MHSNVKLHKRNTVIFHSAKLRKVSRAYDVTKRSLDVILAVILLAISIPMFVLIAVLTCFDGAFKPIFAHSRCGKGGSRFKMYKFRTMYIDAEDILRKNPDLQAQFIINYKLDNDPRVTRLGNILRRTSLDELPQIINVLRGEMSMVGPRPIVADEIQKYGKYACDLFSVKPGLTGLWQISGRSNLTYPERVALDMKYVANRSIMFDLKIIFLTVFKIFTSNTGAQ